MHWFDQPPPFLATSAQDTAHFGRIEGLSCAALSELLRLEGFPLSFPERPPCMCLSE